MFIYVMHVYMYIIKDLSFICHLEREREGGGVKTKRGLITAEKSQEIIIQSSRLSKYGIGSR